MRKGGQKMFCLFLCFGLVLCLWGCEKKNVEKRDEIRERITLTMYSEVEISQSLLEGIEEKLGIHLDVYYPEEGKKKSVEKMIAIGEIPDMIYTKTEGSQLVEAGILMDVRYLLKEYGQNITAQYENGGADMNYNPGDARVLFIPVPEGMIREQEKKDCVYLQYDMMQEYNYEVPASLDELGDLLRHYMKKKKELKEEEVIGLTFLCSEDVWLEGLSLAAGRIADGIEEQGQWIVDENNGYNVIYKHTTKEEKEFFRWLNQMYEEGILDRDFATQTGEDYLEKMKKGKAVCLLDSSLYMQQGTTYLVEKEKFGSTYMAAIKMNQSQKWNILLEGEKRGQGLGITTACKNPEKAIELINALFGSEGEELLLSEEKEAAAWRRFQEYREGLDYEYSTAAEEEEAEKKEFYAIDIQQGDYELDEWTKKLDEISRIGLIQCIICKEAEFEEKWSTLQENLQQAGVERAEIIMMKKYQDYIKK